MDSLNLVQRNRGSGWRVYSVGSACSGCHRSSDGFEISQTHTLFDEINQIAVTNTFGAHQGLVTIASPPPRTIVLPEVLLDGFEHQFSAGRWPNDHIWGDQNGQPLTKEDLEALIVMAAHDAGDIKIKTPAQMPEGAFYNQSARIQST